MLIRQGITRSGFGRKEKVRVIDRLILLIRLVGLSGVCSFGDDMLNSNLDYIST